MDDSPIPPPPTRITYSIAGSSAYSGQYGPEHILVDNPRDQASRWSGAHQSPNLSQWILLRLQKPAVLTQITFGKYHKPHPCNTKDFRVLAGPSEDSFLEVCIGTLKNEPAHERFSIRVEDSAGHILPTRYVKIYPISAHGTSFHPSVWHVSLTGITDENYVGRIVTAYDERREATALRHVLKFLLRRRLLGAYDALLPYISSSSSSTGSGSSPRVALEHPLVSSLHDALVLRGSFANAETVTGAAGRAGLFRAYLRAQPPVAHWTRLRGLDSDGNAPAARGGHALCLDPLTRTLYLHGGWDGARSLDDFWAYALDRNRWTRLAAHTADEGGPGPRSCHRVAFDAREGCVYLLGKLDSVLDAPGVATAAGTRTVAEGTPSASAFTPPATESAPTPQPVEAGVGIGSGAPDAGVDVNSDFYRYHTRGTQAGKWELLSPHTQNDGGPPAIFDHTIAVDPDEQAVYVLGGRVVSATGDGVNKTAGFYKYDINARTWTTLPNEIPPRWSHSMLFDPIRRALLVFGGESTTAHLSDLWTFDVRTQTEQEIMHQSPLKPAPPAHGAQVFTQRATLDADAQELLVVDTYCQSPGTEPNTTTARLTSSAVRVFHYEPTALRWKTAAAPPPSIMYSTSREAAAAGEGEKEPVPRFAHQVVFDPTSRAMIMHGGNAGVPRGAKDEREKRLDDLWKLDLRRTSMEDVVRRATFLIRKQQFREMCTTGPAVQAIRFLQTEVHAIVDHSDAEEAAEFRALMVHLISEESGRMDTSEDTVMDGAPSPEIFAQRMGVFEQILKFVNEDDKEPSVDLADLVMRSTA